MSCRRARPYELAARARVQQLWGARSLHAQTLMLLVTPGARLAAADLDRRMQVRRLRARSDRGPLSHRVIALAAARRLGMAVAEPIRLVVVRWLWVGGWVLGLAGVPACRGPTGERP